MTSNSAEEFFAGIETIPALLHKRVVRTPHSIAHYTQDQDGQWQSTTWRDLALAVDDMATRLASLGLRGGDRLAILAATSQDWEIFQIAAMKIGAAVIGIDPYYPAEQVNLILSDLTPAALIVGDSTLLAQIEPVARGRMRFIVMLAAASEDNGSVLSLASLKTSAGYAHASTAGGPPSSSDPAVIVFSSGTTGTPKPIVYTHAQVCLACRAILDAFDDIDTDCRLVCWLPMANLFQRIINFCAIGKGAITYIVNDPRWVMESLPVANPHLFVAVPRFFERIYRGIEERLDALPRPVAAAIKAALDASVRDHRLRSAGHHVPWPTRVLAGLARRTVVKRLRGIMGNNLKYIVSGSAPCPRWILDTYAGLGIPILEAYGQSENIIPIAANVIGGCKPGTVGRPLRYNEIRLSDEGVVEVRGPGVFDPQLGENRLRASLKPDGYLVTGDLGEIDADGFLTLTGRQSELFKGANGRWISPADIEATLRRVAYVEQAAVTVQQDGIVIAVVAVSLTAYPHATATSAHGPDLVLHDSNALEATLTDFEKELAALARPLWPHGLLLTSRQFSIEGGEITTNFKLRRAAIAQKYQAELTDLAREIATAPLAHREGDRPRMRAL